MSRWACVWPKPQFVGLQERWCFLDDRELRVGFHFPFGHALQIVRNSHYAVRIVPHQVGGNQTFADQRGFLGRNAAGLEECDRELRKLIDGNVGHFFGLMSGSSVSARILPVVPIIGCASTAANTTLPFIAHPFAGLTA